MFEWSTIIPSAISFLLGGGLAGFITAKANKKKIIADASISAAQADGIDIKNAKEIIDMYRAGIKDLNEMHDKQLKDSEDKYNQLKSQVDELTKSLREQLERKDKEIQDIRNKYNELLSMLAGSCATCVYFNDCQKRIDLGIDKKF